MDTKERLKINIIKNLQKAAHVKSVVVKQKKDSTLNNIEYGGFLTTYVRVGDYIFIGDSIVYIKELKSKGVIVAVRAPKNLVIKKSDSIDGDSNGNSE